MRNKLKTLWQDFQNWLLDEDSPDDYLDDYWPVHDFKPE
jgi:hypothetical protein